MSYTKTTDFATKDALLSGNPNKLIKGTELDDEFNALQTADALNLKGASSSTDNALVRFDGTTGKASQNSGVTVDDSGNMTVTGDVTVTGGNVTTTAIGPDADSQHTLPNVASDTVVLLAATQTLTNKTLTAPVINGVVTTTGLTLPAVTLGGTVTSNGQSFSGTIANLGTVTTADINGGTIDGTTVGSISPSTVQGTNVTATQKFYAASGLSAAAPDYSFSADDTLGIFRLTNVLGVAVAGVERARWNNSGTFILQGASTSATGVGVAFPATQSASTDANTLDDYEEGSFTPTVEGTTAAGVGTYSTQTGRYTKIGNRVLFNLEITWTAHTGTGNLRLASLPFTIAAAGNMALSIVCNNLTLAANSVPAALAIAGGTTANLYSLTEAVGTISFVAMDTAATIYVSGQYSV